jgi:hypothetical protein
MIDRNMIATAKRIFRTERKRLGILISQPEEMRGWLTYRTGWSARDIREVVDEIQQQKKDRETAKNSVDRAGRQSD